MREVILDDAPALYANFSDEKVTRYYGRQPMIQPSEAETMVRRMAKRYQYGRAIRWGIVRREDGVFLGTCGYHFQAAGFKAEIGYELGRPYWRCGYMSEALRAVLTYGFDTLQLNRIEALVMPENEASAAVLFRLGFSEEGLLREFVLVGEHFCDMRFFSLLRREADQTLRVLNPKGL